MLLSVFFALVMLQYSVILTAISILFAVFSLVIYSFVTRRQRKTPATCSTRAAGWRRR